MRIKIDYLVHGKDSFYKIWHAAEQATFIYMHSAGGSIVCSEQTYPIQKGVLCFIGEGKYHYTMPEDPKKYVRSRLFISTETVSKLSELVFENKGLFSPNSFAYALIDEKEQPLVDECFRKMKAYENDAAYGKGVLLSAVIELLVFLKRYALKNTTPASGTVSNAINFINQNIAEPLTIDTICKAIHISKYHFCREFKQATEITVMKYILKTRLIMAKNMLLSENLSVTEVSLHCGFSSVSYFSRVFKDEFGISPLKYKRSVTSETQLRI